MFDLLSRAERRATKAVAVFERAKQDLRTANEHLTTVQARAHARAAAVAARAEAEVARITQAAEARAAAEKGRAEKALAAHEGNSRILAKIESLLS